MGILGSRQRRMYGSARLRCSLLAACLIALGVLVSPSGANHGTTQLVSTGSSGGNGSSFPFVVGASADGARVLFQTDESLEPADTDTSMDVYARSGSTTTLISIGSAGGNGAFDTNFVAASTDATRVFFTTGEQLEPDDTDTQEDLYERSGSTTTRISTGPSGGNGAFDVGSFTLVSADGTRAFFSTSESLEAGDTDSREDIYERSGSTTTRISTGSSGGNGAFDAALRDISSNGARVFFTTSEQLQAGDTDSRSDIYERNGSTTTRISTGSSGGNGAFDAFPADASSDGSRFYFETFEPLESSDTDTRQDVYVRIGSTTTQISTGSLGGNGAFGAGFEGASTDGVRVFFSTSEAIEAGDTDATADVYQRSGTTTTRLSTGSSGGNGAFHAGYAGASNDGARVFLTTDESLEPGDTDAEVDVYERSGATTTRMSTGPAGGNGVGFPAQFAGTSADGTRVFFGTDESLEAGDTDSASDVYERSTSTTTRVSTGPSGGNGAFGAGFDRASADGTRVIFSTAEPLLGGDTDSSTDIYVAGLAVTTGYPRPISATPFRVALVPAYDECADPNVGHAAPFAFDACNPPNLASDHLTVGSPDANGAPAKSAGYLKIKVIPGAPGGADDADATLEVSLTDVRNQGGLSDYTGELRVFSELRLTDRRNGSAQTLPGTVVDIPFNVTVPCSATGDTTIGGACALTTSLDTLLGTSAVVEGKRGIYRLDRVDVFDGGADGDVDTPAGNTLFASQGFFVP